MIEWKKTQSDYIGPSLTGKKKSGTYKSKDGRFTIYQRYERSNGYDRAGYHWVLVDMTRQRGLRSEGGFGSLRQAKETAEKWHDRDVD
jgi:hypothetical protein